MKKIVSLFAMVVLLGLVSCSKNTTTETPTTEENTTTEVSTDTTNVEVSADTTPEVPAEPAPAPEVPAEPAPAPEIIDEPLPPAPEPEQVPETPIN